MTWFRATLLALSLSSLAPVPLWNTLIDLVLGAPAEETDEAPPTESDDRSAALDPWG